MDVDEVVRALQSLPKEMDVRHRPAGGTTYVFQWEHEKNKGELLCYCCRPTAMLAASVRIRSWHNYGYICIYESLFTISTVACYTNNNNNDNNNNK